jgi:hypothetical protein
MIQVRMESGDIRSFPTLEDAFVFAQEFTSAWKISFNAETGERVRLIREDGQWIYENVFGNRKVG